MSLKAKKLDYIFEEPLNLHIIVGQHFISSVVDSRRKQNQAEETIQLETQTDTQKTVINFLSSIAVMQVIF